jgi:hypothetical protein
VYSPSDQLYLYLYLSNGYRSFFPRREGVEPCNCPQPASAAKVSSLIEAALACIRIDTVKAVLCGTERLPDTVILQALYLCEPWGT